MTDLLEVVENVLGQGKDASLQSVRDALAQGAQVNVTGLPSTPLIRAVEAERTQMVQMLLEARASANLTDSKGVSPLHIAAFNGAKDMLNLLIQAQANVNAQDRHGQTPIFFAPHRGACAQLSAARANLNLLNNKGQSALHMASHAGLGEVVAWLAENASPGLLNVQDKHGRTAWYCAKNVGDAKTVSLLKDKGANVKLKPHKHWQQKPAATTRPKHIHIPKLPMPVSQEVIQETKAALKPLPLHLLQVNSPEDFFAIVSPKRSSKELPHLSQESPKDQVDSEVVAVLQQVKEATPPATPQQPVPSKAATPVSKPTTPMPKQATPQASRQPTRPPTAREEEPSTERILRDAEDALGEVPAQVVSRLISDGVNLNDTMGGKSAMSVSVASSVAHSTPQTPQVQKLIDLEAEAAAALQPPGVVPDEKEEEKEEEAKEELQPAIPPLLKPTLDAQGCLVWEVDLQKGPGESFGFSHSNAKAEFSKALGLRSLAPVGPEMLFVNLIGESYLLDTWNKENPAAKVEPCDRIDAVNEAVTIKDMQRTLKENDAVKLRMVRYPATFEVNLMPHKQAAVLGLKCFPPDKESHLVIKDIAPGSRMDERNKSNTAQGLFHLVVTPGMRLESVNGVQGVGNKLQRAMFEAGNGTMQLRIRRAEKANMALRKAGQAAQLAGRFGAAGVDLAATLPVGAGGMGGAQSMFGSTTSSSSGFFPGTPTPKAKGQQDLARMWGGSSASMSSTMPPGAWPGRSAGQPSSQKVPQQSARTQPSARIPEDEVAPVVDDVMNNLDLNASLGNTMMSMNMGSTMGSFGSAPATPHTPQQGMQLPLSQLMPKPETPSMRPASSIAAASDSTAGALGNDVASQLLLHATAQAAAPDISAQLLAHANAKKSVQDDQSTMQEPTQDISAKLLEHAKAQKDAEDISSKLLAHAKQQGASKDMETQLLEHAKAQKVANDISAKLLSHATEKETSAQDISVQLAEHAKAQKVANDISARLLSHANASQSGQDVSAQLLAHAQAQGAANDISAQLLAHATSAEAAQDISAHLAAHAAAQGSDHSSKPVPAAPAKPVAPDDPIAKEKKEVVGVMVPEGASPGDRFVVESDGIEYELEVPEGALPGAMMEVELPTGSEASASQPHSARTTGVMVPEGASPGDLFVVDVDGVEYELEVPEGALPGQLMEVELPSRSTTKGLDSKDARPEEEDDPLALEDTRPPDSLMQADRPLSTISDRTAVETISVVIPDGFKTGDSFFIEADGEKYELVVPEGMQPGEVMEVDLPMGTEGAPSEAASSVGGQVVSLTVPPGFKPGDTVAVDVKGRDFEIQIPDGAVPGQLLEIELPRSEEKEPKGLPPPTQTMRGPEEPPSPTGKEVRVDVAPEDPKSGARAQPGSELPTPGPVPGSTLASSSSSSTLRNAGASMFKEPAKNQTSARGLGNSQPLTNRSVASSSMSMGSTSASMRSSGPMPLPDGCLVWEVHLRKNSAEDRFGFAHFSGYGDFLRARGQADAGEETPGPTPVSTPGRGAAAGADDMPKGRKAPRVLVVREVAPHLLLGVWNRANPSKEVCPYDRIFSVNSRTRVEEMQQELRRASAVVLRIVRYPQIFPVELKGPADRPLGLAFERPSSESIKELRVTQVHPDGALESYNQAQIKLGRFHLVVLPGMLIRRVNQAQSDVDGMEKALEGAFPPILLHIRRGDQALMPGSARSAKGAGKGKPNMAQSASAAYPSRG